MKKFISILNIIIGSIAVSLSILFLAVAIDSPFLAVVGLVVAPVIIIYLNKKFKIKAPKYYLTLFGVMLVAIVVSGIIMPKDVNISNQQEIAIENESNETKEDTEAKEDSKAAEEKEDSKAEDNSKDAETKENSTAAKEDILEGYRLIEVDGGNLSGHREPNVVVDIGFGDREYWAYTNEYGQLVKVVAKQIVLQDDSTEPVNSNGRYYPDEAKVSGVESKDLDEGHVIADSLGGVSNAYNITPQNSTLNRHGDQAYMEKVIRDAGGCTEFVAIITYPDTTTQIPSHYSYTYTLNGNVINDEFDNINPDEYNANSGINDSDSTSNESSSNVSSSNTGSSNTGNSNASSGGAVTTNEPAPNERTVYWTPSGKSYHYDRNCRTLARSKTILEGPGSQSPKTDPCNVCAY